MRIDSSRAACAVLVILGSCSADAAPRASVAAAPVTGRAEAIERLRASPHGIATVSEAVEEASGTGGLHVFFDVETHAGASLVAHCGGHGVGFRGRLMADEPDDFARNALYVVGFERVPRQKAISRGWDPGHTPLIDAEVTVLVPVGSREEGLALLTSLDGLM